MMTIEHRLVFLLSDFSYCPIARGNPCICLFVALPGIHNERIQIYLVILCLIISGFHQIYRM